MVRKRKMSKLILPCQTCKKMHDGKCNRKNLPRFSTRIFQCYRQRDVERFEKLLEEKNAIHILTQRCNITNSENESIPFGRYIILYDYFEDIDTWIYT